MSDTMNRCSIYIKRLICHEIIAPITVLLMAFGAWFILAGSQDFDLIEGTLINKYIYTQNCYECPLNNTYEQCTYMKFQFESSLQRKCDIISLYDPVIYDKFIVNELIKYVENRNNICTYYDDHYVNELIQYVENRNNICTYYDDHYVKMNDAHYRNFCIGLPLFFSGFVLAVIGICFAVTDKMWWYHK